MTPLNLYVTAGTSKESDNCILTNKIDISVAFLRINVPSYFLLFY